MKLSLVVAQGVHNGKVIPISAAQFLIGRDPHCQLRPSSPAISKQHAGIIVRDGKVFVKDYGSTNGTFVNGEQVADEREIRDGDHLKVGPLEFTVKIEATAPAAVAASPSAKTVATPKQAKPKETMVAAPGVGTPKAKVPTPKPVAVPAAVAQTSKGTADAPPDVPEETISASTGSDATAGDNADEMAAMLLMDDVDESGSSSKTAEQAIPDGSTVMDVPAIPGAAPPGGQAPPKTSEKQDNSRAAADLLKKMWNRPRT